MTTFFVAGVPVPQGSMKGFVVGKRAIVTSDNKRLKPWRSQVAEAAQAHFDTLILGAVSLTIVFVMPRPSSTPKRSTPHAIKKPDCDKLLRGCLDALTGVVWRDDSQVVYVTMSKRLAEIGEQSGAHIRIEALT